MFVSNAASVSGLCSKFQEFVIFNYLYGYKQKKILKNTYILYETDVTIAMYQFHNFPTFLSKYCIYTDRTKQFTVRFQKPSPLTLRYYCSA